MSAPREDLSDEIAVVETPDGEDFDARQLYSRFEISPDAPADGGPITPEECARWRRTLRDSAIEQLTIVKDTGYSKSTIHRHVNDKCNHTVDEPPIESEAAATEAQR